GGRALPGARVPAVLWGARWRGGGAVNRVTPAPLNAPPRKNDTPPPAPPPFNPPPFNPPAIAGKQPLSEPELGQILQALASNNPALVNNAMIRLTNVEPVDAQRERVVNAVKPFATVSNFHADMHAARVLGVWGTREVVPILL